MTSRFDLAEFLGAGGAALQEYLAEHLDLPRLEPGTTIDWPPQPHAKSDLARLRVAFIRVAFELIRRRYGVQDAAARFVEIVLLADAAGEHALRAAVKVAGYGEAAGRQRLKAERTLAIIEQCIREGCKVEDMIARTGASRRTVFRYLGQIRDGE